MGSYEREACRAAGAAQSLLQPFLDNQVSILVATISLHVANCPLTRRLSPTPLRLSSGPIVNSAFFIYLDLLQESNSCTGLFAPRALAFTRRSLHRDRLVHQCDRASYRGGLLFPILVDD